jgi:hypothetical protein
MKKKETTNEIEKLFLKQIHSIVDSLTTHLPLSILENQLQTESWSNPNGVVMAFISFNPKQDSLSDTIDLTLAVSPKGNIKIISSDIAWSNGKIIEEIFISELLSSDSKQLFEEVNHLLQSNAEIMISKISNIISQHI